MMHLRRCMLVAACVPWVAGCSAGLIGSNRAEYRESVRFESAPDGREEARTGSASLRLPDAPALHDYIRVALARNPALAAAREQARASGYEIAEATGLADPVLTVVPPTGDLAETAAGEVDGSIGLRQTIPSPAKLYARGRAASHAAVSAREVYRSRQLETISAVRRAYYSLYFADRSIELTERSRRLLRDFRAVALRKYEAGQVPQQDVLRAQVELAGLESDLVVLRRQRRSFQARLNYLMANPSERPLPITPPITADTTELALEQLTSTAFESSPAIGAAQGHVHESRERLRLAKLDYWPDLTVGFTHTSVSSTGLSPVANGDDSEQLTLSVNLPVWFERLGASKQAARARVRASENHLEQTINTTRFQVEDSFLKAESRRTQLELFSGVIIPQAQQTLDATMSAYRAGDVDFLTFIENWRRLLDLKVAYQRNLSEFEQELAELERLIGAPLAEASR